MFRSIYESALYSPLLFWIAGASLLLVVASRLPFLYAYLVAFGVEILADATLTGPWSPVPPNGMMATALSIVFVILGDLRLFVLIVRGASRGAVVSARGWLLAIALSLVVPIGSFVPQRLFPAAFVDGRVTYLTYEAMFFVFAAGVRLRMKARAPDGPWAIHATHFVLAQYGLWAIADVIILAGYDAGFALRLVPNTMYYVLYLPFVAWTAPRALVSPCRHEPAS